MQQVVADKITISIPCTHVSPSEGSGNVLVLAPSGGGLGGNASFQCTSAYTNNMNVINQNFIRLQETNTHLAQKLTETNVQLKSAQEQLTEFKTSLESLQAQNQALLDELKEQKSIVSTLSTSVSELTKKIATIIAYIPQFVRESSSNFLRLLTGTRTDTVNTVNTVPLDDVPAIEF